jgi:hypothetical protein
VLGFSASPIFPILNNKLLRVWESDILLMELEPQPRESSTKTKIGIPLYNNQQNPYCVPIVVLEAVVSRLPVFKFLIV